MLFRHSRFSPFFNSNKIPAVFDFDIIIISGQRGGLRRRNTTAKGGASVAKLGQVARAQTYTLSPCPTKHSLIYFLIVLKLSS